MRSLELVWLGPPGIICEGQPVKLETRKAVALLAMLSVEKRPLGREYLTAVLWPEFGADRAPANLRRTLSSLQSSIGKEWIASDRESLELGTRPGLRVDIDVLVSRTNEVYEHHPDDGSGLCDSCLALLREVLTGSKGMFLEGLNLPDAPEFDLWQAAIRDDTSQRLSRAYERLISALGDRGELDEATEQARRWVAIDDAHEPAHRTLMLLYAQAGKRSAALRQYDLCVQRLNEDLGMEPDESTKRLWERIRTRRFAASALSPPASARPRDHRLRPPVSRSALVSRERLFRFLDEGTSRPVTLISAPAGFGKTTLLCEWVHRSPFPVAWYSLEEADRDPRRFLGGIAAACGSLDPAIGAEASEMLSAVQPAAPERAIASVLGDLDRERTEAVLVLDDLHLLEGSDAEPFVAKLVDGLPGSFHLFIATRSDPGLPLARMRARGQLAEVRADDLRFETDELRAFLADVMGVELSGGDRDLLAARTEGWPAGVQMAALSLQKADDRSGFVRRLSGSHRYIMDYLAEEVVDRLPEQTRDFLLRTSIIDRFCAGICDAIVGRPGSQDVLEDLERSNLFTVPLDDDRSWYRYHRLFADLLQHRLHRTLSAEQIAELHRRAGAWFEREREIERSVDAFLRARAHGDVLRLVETHYQRILTDGRLRLLLSWMSSVPDEVVREDAMASVLFGVFLAFAGDGAAAERWFTIADGILDRTGDDSERGETAQGRANAVRAFLADMMGRTDAAIEFASAARSLVPEWDLMTRSLIPYTLARAWRLRGDLDRAISFLDEEAELSRLAGNTWTLAGAVHEKVLVYTLGGTLREADRELDEFFSSLPETSSRGPLAKTISGRAELLRERRELDQAVRLADEALAVVTRWGLPSDICYCLQNRVRIAISTGDAPATREMLARVDHVIRTARVYSSIPVRHATQHARLIALLQDPAQADAWLAGTGRAAPGAAPPGNPIDRESLEIARARLLTVAGRAEEAVQLLAERAVLAETGGRIGRLIEILVLQATARMRTDGSASPSAAESLIRALELAQPERYASVFLDEGEPIIGLLSRLHETPQKLSSSVESYRNHLINLA